jgi:hypothetical protein
LVGDFPNVTEEKTSKDWMIDVKKTNYMMVPANIKELIAAKKPVPASQTVVASRLFISKDANSYTFKFGTPLKVNLTA